MSGFSEMFPLGELPTLAEQLQACLSFEIMFGEFVSEEHVISCIIDRW